MVKLRLIITQIEQATLRLTGAARPPREDSFPVILLLGTCASEATVKLRVEITMRHSADSFCVSTQAWRKTIPIVYFVQMQCHVYEAV